MRFIDFMRNKLFGNKDIASSPGPVAEERLTFINNNDEIIKNKIAEYNVWYNGDGDELLNFYTYHNTIDYNFEPWYWRNKKNYFWAIGSTEEDIKRTHSGQPRNIVDTLVSIIKFPIIEATVVGETKNVVNDKLKLILKDCKFSELYKQEQMPLTLIEGWGCYKINWDLDVSDHPLPVYYTANNVDFIYKYNRIVGIVFKDYYTDKSGQQYLLTETRQTKLIKTEEKPDGERYLVIDKELFKCSKDGTWITTEDFASLPQLSDIETHIEIGPTDMLLAVPCIFFKSTAPTGEYGRSIFNGKLDLFDDLDQALSQSSNTVRKSTPIEYINSEYLERDPKTGLPIQPKAYDRKYSVYSGGTNADGSVAAGDPVTVTQPALNFQEYSQEAVNILLQIINGVLSPATLGIELAKKDNAEAQREKEKMTIFTRNNIIDSEEQILRELCNQMLCAEEFMHTGKITCPIYDISVKFSEFADDSFESKLKALGDAYDRQQISTDMYMTKLYGDTLGDEGYEKEKQFLIDHHDQPRKDGMQGIMGGGQNAPGLINNMTSGDIEDE